MALPDFFPKTDPELDIGGPNGFLLVGASFDRPYNFTSFTSDCVDAPVDFTGFIIVADILDSANAVLDTFTVTPSVGDATGAFVLHLDPAQVTTSLMASAVKWQFRIVAGIITNDVLIYANFTVT